MISLTALCNLLRTEDTFLQSQALFGKLFIFLVK